MDHPYTGTIGEAARARPPAGVAELIAPIAVDTFMDHYWEKQPLVVQRDERDFYAGLLTLADIDLILATSSLHDGDLRVVADGAETSVTQLIQDDLESKTNGLEAVYREYRAGATINLTFLHERWAPLAGLCRSLSTQLSAAIHGNVYLTPPGTRGLTPHHDNHDVFVLQLHGSKHWTIYPTQTPLPLKDQHFSMPAEGVGEPVQEFTVTPGDLVYLPRGTVHAATADDATSLHLTIGVSPMVWAAVVRTAIDRVFHEDVRFRTALPAGFADSDELRARATADLRGLLEVLTAEISPKDVIRESVGRVFQRRQPVLAGHLLDLEAAPSVDLHTPLRVRPDLEWLLSRDDEEVHLEFHGKRIDLPAYVGDELSFMVKADRFAGTEIPGSLDDAGRLVLVRQLLQEGFLTLS
jgi:ribosomal protein L16 Arg81 hydroxylase